MTFHHSPGETVLSGPIPEKTLARRRREDDQKNLEQFTERVVALFKHYGVAPGDFVTLAYKLAEAHVPGFRFLDPGEKGRGRPSGVGNGEKFVERVEMFREILSVADKKGLKRACELLSEKPKSRCYAIKPPALRKTITNAKRAPLGDPNRVALEFAQFIVDRGNLGLTTEGNADDGIRAGRGVKRYVRNK